MLAGLTHPVTDTVDRTGRGCGVFSEPKNGVGATWGLTAVLCCALAASLVDAVLASEPAAQADMATVAPA